MTNQETQARPPSYVQRDASPLGTRVEPPYFFGLHERWTDIAEDPFSTVGWIDHCEAGAKALGVGLGKPSPWARWSLKRLAKRLLRGGDIPNYLSIPLGVIRETINRTGHIRVLDIGGGYGDNYQLLSRCLSLSPGQLTFHVVDNKRSCLLGERLFGTSAEGLSFSDAIPQEKYDLVIVIGTLQYIRDWRGFLASVASVSSGAIYISRTPMRLDGSTFITLQSICPATGSHALRKVGEANVSVIGSEDLRLTMQANGYQLDTEKLHADYSQNFTRLPDAYRNIAYVGSLWKNLRKA